MLYAGPTHAQNVPTIDLHGVTIKPYATDQLDVGGFADASPAHPGTGHGARACAMVCD
ncbi:hypothetical protein RAA17_26115 [Komagataeibacter rhaeticus]|nr:hypothetical protein [Komagataeibacter rhaeticus]